MLSPRIRTSRRALLCRLLLVMLAAGLSFESQAAEQEVPGARFDSARKVAFPESPAVIDLTRAPYSARGDGVTDDTAALQQAINDHVGQARILYLPAGTYLITRSIRWPKRNSASQEAWGKTTLQGENAMTTRLRLQDGTFTDPGKPDSIMWCGGFGSADWFHNYVQDLTFDVGDRNPGAIGLQFYSNNSGGVRDCRFVAGSDSGAIGLDLAHRDMNGPLLVRNCEVTGFRKGISAAHAVNGQTFEHITLRGQTEVGLENAGQALSLRGVRSENSVPAIRSYGVLCLVEAHLTGERGADHLPAIISYNGGTLFLREVRTNGYGRAVGDVATPDWTAALRLAPADQPLGLGPQIREYSTRSPTTLFPGSSGSLKLPVREPPEVPLDPPTTWASVDSFGADPTGVRDSSAAIQRAIDSGATTIFFPGNYTLEQTVVIRGKARRLTGVGGWIDYHARVKPDFRIADGDSPVVQVDHLSAVHGGILLDTRRTIVFRSVSDADLTATSRTEGGELFLEDFVTHDLRLRRQKVWARQLNVENEGTHLLNDASDVWILGYKTERGGTLLETRGGGRSEVLGGFSYTTTAGQLAPMFVTDDSALFAFFHEVCFNGDPFATLIRETRRGETRTLPRGAGGTTPFGGVPSGP